MGERQKYSQEFKNALRVKLLNPGNKTKTEICREAGVDLGTAGRWAKPRDKNFEMKKQKNTYKWSAEQKLKVLIETASLSESELGAYLRKEGLFSHQLSEWKNEFITSVGSIRKAKPGKDVRDQKIKTLEREILRKDKAVATAASEIGKTVLVIAAGEIWNGKTLRPSLEDVIGAGAILSCLSGS